MLQDKIILFVTKDNNIPLKIEESLPHNTEYQIVSSPTFTNQIRASLIFCEHTLIPDHVVSSTDYIVLFDTFEEEAITRVLNGGARSYLLRPVTVKVIDAVIRAFLRDRHSEAIPESISFGECTFHLLNLLVDTPKGKIHLTPSEAGILKKLLLNRGCLCLRKNLLGEINSNNKEIVARNVDVHIASLRKKLGSYGGKISTIRGVGYLFLNE